MSEKYGRVYLVGAGCGTADLITVRGMSLLNTCSAVVYDELIDPALLDAAPQAEKFAMGKRSGRHSAPQEEICARLISLAQEGKQVVRLKGGDPFVFGRGGEEAQALQAAGVPFEVVPGISSALAVPALAGVPVTHRGVSRSVHIVTAHTAGTADGLPEDLDRLAQMSGTLVFLMGLSRLEQIAAWLTGAGMAPETPAAVLSGGNAPHPADVRGTLADIAARTRRAGVQAPAVIVVGETAAMRLTAPPERKPLDGVRVGLTGTDQMQGRLVQTLAPYGAETVPIQQTQVCPQPLSVDLGELTNGPRWMVFTSRNGVELFFQRLMEQKIDLRRLSGCKFAVIGPSTGAKLEEFGVYPDLCPAGSTTHALAEALLDAARPGEPIDLFRSAQGNRELPAALTPAHPVRDISLYDLVNDPLIAEQARPRMEELDYLVFSSASGVELFFQVHGGLPKKAVCVCIGPVTALALKKRYDKPFLLASDISAGGIARVILRNHHAVAQQ